MRRRGSLFAGSAVLSLVLAALPAPALGGVSPIASVGVSGSPFYPNGDGIRETVGLTVSLTRSVQLSVDVVDFDGGGVATVLSSTLRDAGLYKFSWSGLDGAAHVVDDGPYSFKIIASSNGSHWTQYALFTKAAKVIFPARPAAIVVAVDPGHGDVYSEPGRVTSDGTREADIDLDEGLRLKAMLDGAGVRTTISRTLDQGANTPEWDRNGDGNIGYKDELEARCDIANQGRADVFVAIHNNFASSPLISGPSTYYWDERPYSGASYALAKLVQTNMLARLNLYRTDSWYPSTSHGVLTHPYFVLHQYDPPLNTRPTEMPAVLSEGMFMTKPYELYLLKQPRVRQSMAAAYYDAIQAWIAQRDFAVGYMPMDVPTTAAAGGTATYRIRVVNKGMQPADGLSMEARYVAAVTLYDGTPERGVLLGSVAVPHLAPGMRSTLTMALPAPPAGDWLVKFDVVQSGGTAFSDLGSPVLQLPISVTAAP